MKRFCLCSLVLICAVSSLAAKEKGKVALLFLMVGEHAQANLWGQIMRKEGSRFNVYVHNKEWISHPFFVLHTVKWRVKTTWMEHLEAWRYLLRQALVDTKNKRFVFLSDGCIPLRPMGEIYNILMSEKKSIVNYFRPWWPPGDNRDLVGIPPEHRWVNSEWVALNRKHAQLMIEDEVVMENVIRHAHSSEAYTATLFSFYNALEGQVVNRPITHVDFNRGSDSHPYLFEDASEENKAELRRAKKEGCLFARKISKTFPPAEILKIMHEK